ncbi:hypothetical protein A4X06_0g8165 [Tilletia controversa]|uniref:Uncharacterized protein n=1 Tax=Tilletia controversa TaxID=13291 RepID=A0A8X7MKU8_9BASI|nr:hypothetical protein A4X06_0g8165 [Tilletia controversa]
MHGSQLQHTAGINHGDLEIFNIALGALSLEPFSSSPPRFSDKWLTSYNLQWGIGDLIAGITVALLLVSQSMCYAQLLQPPSSPLPRMSPSAPSQSCLSKPGKLSPRSSLDIPQSGDPSISPPPSLSSAVPSRSVWHRLYSSYIPPPSNNELDPSGVDSSLFEEDSMDDYTNTRHSLQLLMRIRPSASASTTAEKDQPVPFPSPSPSSSSSRTTIHRPLLSPADTLADLIVHLGIPTIEYIRAALRSIQADNPTLCSSANVLTWLRLAPSVQQLQAQAQLCAFPDLYAGIPHQHFTKLELSPRRHVQDRTRAAANIMFQNCLALFTQRGSFSRAVADLREALLLSVERGLRRRTEQSISALAPPLRLRLV